MLVNPETSCFLHHFIFKEEDNLDLLALGLTIIAQTAYISRKKRTEGLLTLMDCFPARIGEGLRSLSQAREDDVRGVGEL